MKLNSILTETVEQIARITPPPVPKKLVGNATDAKAEENSNLVAIRQEIEAVRKPVICFLGAFNSGKTFLIRHLMGKDILRSGIKPTTSAITVLRHVEDKPVVWDSQAKVFALRPGARACTQRREDILDFGGYERISEFTTYPETRRNIPDIVIIFLEDEFLRDKVILDVPGNGGFEEALFDDAGKKPTKDEKKRSQRERLLQAQAMAESDGFVLLSSMRGSGAFYDANVAFLLSKLADNAERFPAWTKPGNILLVGSQADPTEEQLSNTGELMASIRLSIQRQVRQLPAALQGKLDVNALYERIVLFYSLDRVQSQKAVERFTAMLRYLNPGLPEEEVRRRAEEDFHQHRAGLERVGDFKAAFSTMVTGLHVQAEVRCCQFAQTRLTTALEYFLGRSAYYYRLSLERGLVLNLGHKRVPMPFSREEFASLDVYHALNAHCIEEALVQICGTGYSSCSVPK